MELQWNWSNVACSMIVMLHGAGAMHALDSLERYMTSIDY